ncbi:MAG: response regulator [Candidatus Margulisbacteria bacterium]|nr:response regulator [Candidatus Margulisiibacteriota bacterium]
MNKPIKVLLIDDNESCNFITERVLSKTGLAGDIAVKLNGKEALDYLMDIDKDRKISFPELIFLDINMPVMDGFEFLDQYEKAGFNKKLTRIVMLTSSMMESDRQRAFKFQSVVDYLEKFMDVQKANEIIHAL